MANLQACIFDLDGVLVDTARYHFKSWQRLAHSLDIYFDEEMNEQLKGVSRVQSLEQILKWGGIRFDEKKKEELCIQKNEWYLEYLEHIDENEILPYADDFILHVHQSKIKIALGSASKNAIKVLQETNLIKYFDAIIDGNETINTKPHPEVFLKASEALEVLPENAIVFEDSGRGIDAAISGNFKSVGIGEEQNLGHAQMVIPSFKDVTLDNFKGLFE
jgi:beta-phosphoglucomutase